jgi:hypothetical protein
MNTRENEKLCELVEATQCAQEMLYLKNTIESLNLKAYFPMKSRVDIGANDLINNWSIGGRTNKSK